MQNVLSSKSRMDRVVSDIVFDFSVKPRLSSERGNARLVASSIYEACKYFTLFQKTPFKGKCAVMTSYNPLAKDVTKEETGANIETDKQFIFNAYAELLEDVAVKPGMTKTETYEERAKELFTKEPVDMKLLVVVDKLLTGFDAPPCTYLYIDKSMQDHGFFQAICRTNRLDGDDKDFGYIVDYKDLFNKVENAIAVYTSELDHSSGGAAPEVLLKDRLKLGKERLDNALETLALLCEPVEPPKGELEYIHFFCGNTEIPTDLQEREPKRSALYKATVAMVRAYREQLKKAVPPLIAKWEALLGVEVNQFFVRRMKTKWGSCNPADGNIRLNTDLAKKPSECLEYIVVHEMMHLLEPTHNARFRALMERFMPKWKFYIDQLNRLPVSHEEWGY